MSSTQRCDDFLARHDYLGADQTLALLGKFIEKSGNDELGDPQKCYEAGQEDARSGRRSPVRRSLIQPEEKECLAKYDEGFKDGSKMDPMRANDTMDEISQGQIERNKETTYWREELEKTLRGEEYYEQHTHSEGSEGLKVVTPTPGGNIETPLAGD